MTRGVYPDAPAGIGFTLYTTLEQAYAGVGRKDVIIPFLRSPQAGRIFADANRRLRTFQSRHGRQALVETALKYLDEVVDADYQPNPALECPR